MAKKIAIVWFRQDLRLQDNPALIAAHEAGHTILPVYILDDVNSGEWAMGGASRWWLHHSLQSLDQSLNKKLFVRAGDALKELTSLIDEHSVDAVYWNRCYEPWQVARDKTIKQALKDKSLDVKSFNASLLFEPHTTLKDDGTPYKVFTPFYKRGCLAKNSEPALPQPAPDNLKFVKDTSSITLADLGLIPKIPWYTEMEKEWQPGEEGAAQRLSEFTQDGLNGYKEGRNLPSVSNVSRLSPHMHFGEISPRSAWHAAKTKMLEQNWETDGETFLSELGWREFSYNLLFYFPDLPRENLQTKFNDFPWRSDKKALTRWQTGTTGYPIVDAGMRELWQTGYMHNRVRMIVGSFLVKNLLLHWHHGEEWFWDCLLDADLASNSASWQWIAGCGADAAPYFRIFNPVTQSKKFDKEGAYIRRFVPELSALPEKYIHAPWETPSDVLSDAGVKIGKDYPEPIVDLKESRERALAAFKKISGK